MIFVTGEMAVSMETKKIDIPQTCELLRKAQDILVLSHMNPDGDTLGAAHALLYTLRLMGKRAKFLCADPVAPRYDYIWDTLEQDDFDPKYIVAVDIADTNLFGKELLVYKERIDLCIDHHPSNSEYSKYLLLDSTASATCELLLEVIEATGVEIDKKIANSLFTGITTDTGCFRYSSVTPRTHNAAARLIQAGADAGFINRLMFETVSKGRLALQNAALNTLEYHLDERLAIMLITRDMIEKNNCIEDDLTGLSALPRQIEGVIAGATFKEAEDRAGYKISFRTFEGINASEVCQRLGGGGHMRAAGCYIRGNFEKAKSDFLLSVKECIN